MNPDQIPTLESTARRAWTLAFQARHAANFGRAGRARNQAREFLKAPHPNVRRLARDLWPSGDQGGAAA